MLAANTTLEDFYQTKAGSYFRAAEELGEAFIPAADQREADSLRAYLINARKKLPGVFGDIFGVKKQEVRGKWFTVVYKREVTGIMKMEDGVLIPVDMPSFPEGEVDKERIRKLMLEDGSTEEEIEDYFKSSEEKKEE